MTQHAITKRLEELGIVLPAVAAPVAAYVPATVVGNQVWTSGQLPFSDGQLLAQGRVGDAVTTEEAKSLARTAALNALAAIDHAVGIDRVCRVLSVTGYVCSADGFTDQAQVINGASNLLGEIFGAQGAHVRAAVGVYQLPLDAPVEISLVVELGEE